MTATISGDGTSTLINLTTSGNTILGDASTDTLNVGNGGLVKDASGNVGIGTSSPTPYSGEKVLDVYGSGTSSSVRVRNSGGTNGAMFYTSNADAYLWNVGNSFLSFGTNNGEKMRIDSSGVLLLGTTSAGATPSALLQIGGTSTSSRVLPRTDNTGYVGDSGQRWQAVYAVNGTIQTSDGREKNTIQDSNLGLSFINSLRPVSYKWNVGENVVTYDEEGNEVVTPRAGARTHYGFIAQEVQATIPSGVDFGGFVQEPDDGPMSLRYHEFIGPLVKAIQEQQAIITTLQADVEALKAQP